MAPNPLRGVATLVADPFAAAAYARRALKLPTPGESSLREAVRDRRVVVTGASSGIGRRAAERIGAAGAHVTLVARRRRELESVAQAIERRGGSASVHACDLSEAEEVDRLTADVLAEQGGVDVLVNNAGHSIRRWVSESYDRPQDYELTLALNYLAPVRMVLAFVPGMRERGFGHIVNVSSIGVLAGTPRFSAYLASKAALDMFSRSLAPEVVGEGLHVTTIYMPLVRTPMIEPTPAWDSAPALGVDDASRMVTRALVDRPREVTPLPGLASRFAYPVAPKTADRVVGGVMRLFSSR